MSQWALFALAAPGHVLELDAITQREALLGVRRKVLRDTSLNAKATEAHDRAQEFQGGRPIARVWQPVAQLEWKWPAYGTMLDDWGTPLSWLNLPVGMITAMLRASQRRFFLRRIPATRHDLGAVAAARQGIDYSASTWLQRTKGRARCTAWQFGLLCNYLGGYRAQQRRARAGTSADPSPLCRWRDEEEETQKHTIWWCPCRAQERQALTTMISPDQRRDLPPTYAPLRPSRRGLPAARRTS